jgi:hypothetical protein
MKQEAYGPENSDLKAQSVKSTEIKCMSMRDELKGTECSVLLDLSKGTECSRLSATSSKGFVYTREPRRRFSDTSRADESGSVSSLEI